ncbi:hypothetical protein [Pseudoalteromonas sp. OOF1S-7]|uniref:hypothetical protein n=1 Tax=Pseudoalteromonas sp. OOF1S-7 TaxID=2917757 RepID=UPI001EF448FE|nr:hypothetical protein [Pseudoalteromonas sp. OOF1S-7]MCG7537911.1 hypothetical protein [Pseudoalteromonas sp. OOF1S-7]
MNTPPVELILANTRSTVVRHKLPSTTYGAKDELLRIMRNAYDMGEFARNIYMFAIDGAPDASRKNYIGLLVEYDNDHFDLFDRCKINIGNRSREHEVTSLLRSMSLLANYNHIVYTTKRIPHTISNMPPLEAACVIKMQAMKPLLSNWHAFTSTCQEDYTLISKSVFAEKEWDSLYPKAKMAIRTVEMVSLSDMMDRAGEFECLRLGRLGVSRKRVVVGVSNMQATVCVVDKEALPAVIENIGRGASLYVYEDMLPESLTTSPGQRVLSINKIHCVAFTEKTQNWV